MLVQLELVVLQAAVLALELVELEAQEWLVAVEVVAEAAAAALELVQLALVAAVAAVVLELQLLLQAHSD